MTPGLIVSLSSLLVAAIAAAFAPASTGARVALVCVLVGAAALLAVRHFLTRRSTPIPTLAGQEGGTPPVDAVDERLTIAELNSVGRMSPDSWCIHSNSNGPELVVRSAVSLPGPVAGTDSTNLATTIRGEQREKFLIDLLESHPFTAWLRNERYKWQWVGEPRWIAAGASNALELTTLVFEPIWTKDAGRKPFAAQCHVFTGWSEGGGKAIRVALDVAMNLLELDAARHPSSIRHDRTPPPAPAALSLNEFADVISRTLTVGELATEITQPLLGTEPPRHGVAGTWAVAQSVDFSQVLDLGGLRRLPGSATSIQESQGYRWVERTAAKPPGHEAAVDFIGEMLQRQGYREAEAVLRDLREA